MRDANMDEPAQGSSHAKIIFVGEHSAVYNKPAIVFPIPQIKVTATLTTGHDELSSSYFHGHFCEMPAEMDGLKTLIERLNQRLNPQHVKLNLTIDSEIPLGRGLGSSAATASAVTDAFFHLFKKEPTPSDLKRFTDVEEKITHGNPSGIDAKTVNASHPILFENGSFTTFKFKSNGILVIADTGVSSKTSEAVRKVSQEMKQQPEFTKTSIDNLGVITDEIVVSLRENNLTKTGKLMDEAQIQLDALGVSTKQLNQLVLLAIQSGALGAKLTGSGLGGCMIALADSTSKAKQIAAALRQSGAEKVWIQSLSEIS